MSQHLPGVVEKVKEGTTIIEILQARAQPKLITRRDPTTKSIRRTDLVPATNSFFSACPATAGHIEATE